MEYTFNSACYAATCIYEIHWCSHLLLASAKFVTMLLRISSVSTPCCSFRLLVTHQAFGRPVLLLPILTSHTDVASAYLRWSILATLPLPHFHLRMSHCHDVLRDNTPITWHKQTSLHDTFQLNTPIIQGVS